jgi:metallo-beta-lactamase family protein
MPKLTFLGATRTVTGSRFLLELRGFRLLVDCGLFQGPPEIRKKNREPMPVEASAIDAILLTHAHVDHTGYIPRLVRDGFGGPIFASPPTAALLGLLLPDSAHLQEEEARFANKKGLGVDEPIEPLYGINDAKAALRQLVSIRFGIWEELHPGVRVRLHRAGHILGAAFVEVRFRISKGGHRTIVFSGDVGRYDVPILHDPEPLPATDLLVLESTYGNRLHGPELPREALEREVKAAMARGGAILIPAFAVGRVQDVLYDLAILMDEKRLPEWPVYVDSPMARSATQFYRQFHSEHDLDLTTLEEAGRNPFERRNLHFVRAQEESKDLNDRSGEAIVVSASGMASGGRILHHLRNRLSDPKATVLFVGYQAIGTRGRALVEGARSVEIFGAEIPVEAKIVQIPAFSAHADADGLLRWSGTAPSPPEGVALVHGELDAQEALRDRLATELGWVSHIPEFGDSIDL